MRLYVLLVSAVALLSVVTAIGFDAAADSCKKGNCDNICQAQGKSCCFCDQTKNYNLQACFCCPKDYFCCGSETWKFGSAHCCPNGYSCTKNGTCTVLNTVPITSAVGVSRNKCRPDTNVYVTVDNEFSLYVDGKEQKLDNPGEWEDSEEFNLPGTAKQITICAENDQYKAGILISSEITDIIGRAVWRCFSSIEECPGKWTETAFDDSDWKSAELDEKNNGLSTRKVIVPNIPQNTPWVWCNKSNTTHTTDWEKYCTCRIWLPDYSYGFQ